MVYCLMLKSCVAWEEVCRQQGYDPIELRLSFGAGLASAVDLLIHHRRQGTFCFQQPNNNEGSLHQCAI